jgi:hypothetical protein
MPVPADTKAVADSDRRADNAGNVRSHTGAARYVHSAGRKDSLSPLDVVHCLSRSMAAGRNDPSIAV